MSRYCRFWEANSPNTKQQHCFLDMVLQVFDFFKDSFSRNDWGRSQGKFRWYKSGFTGHWGNCTEAAEALETFGGKPETSSLSVQSAKFVRSKRCHDNVVSYLWHSLAINLNWRMSKGDWPMPNWTMGVTVPADGWKTSIEVQEPKVKHIHGASRQGLHRDQTLFFPRSCCLECTKTHVFFTTVLHLHKQKTFTMFFLCQIQKVNETYRNVIYTVFGPPYKKHHKRRCLQCLVKQARKTCRKDRRSKNDRFSRCRVQ